MHAAKSQLLVVAKCNLVDYIQSLHAQSSWIDAQSGIATDVDTKFFGTKEENSAHGCMLDAFGSCIQMEITFCV
jgi:hypothetical protein